MVSAGRPGASTILQPEQLVVLESTTYPGTTRQRLLPILEESGLAAGRDFHLAFSPERIDPGRTDYTIRTTPKLVGGVTPACTERARELYSLICEEVVVLSTPETAEPLLAATSKRLPRAGLSGRGLCAVRIPAELC